MVVGAFGRDPDDLGPRVKRHNGPVISLLSRDDRRVSLGCAIRNWPRESMENLPQGRAAASITEIIATDQEYALPQSSSIGKLRANLGVPLLRDGTVIGMLTPFRQHVEPFTDRQIDLVKTFADQVGQSLWG